MGPWPSQDRVLIFKHKPPKPEFVGSKPIGPVIPIVLQLDSSESEYMEKQQEQAQKREYQAFKKEVMKRKK